MGKGTSHTSVRHGICWGNSFVCATCCMVHIFLMSEQSFGRSTLITPFWCHMRWCWWKSGFRGNSELSNFEFSCSIDLIRTRTMRLLEVYNSMISINRDSSSSTEAHSFSTRSLNKIPFFILSNFDSSYFSEFIFYSII